MIDLRLDTARRRRRPNCQQPTLLHQFIIAKAASFDRLLATKFFLTILVIILSVFGTTTTASIVIEKRSFTDAEIDLIKRTFLKKLNMVEQPVQTRPVLPVPKYIWNLYSRVQNEDIDSIRHYYPQRIMETNERMLLLRYNLTVSAQNNTDEVIISAVLKLKLNRGLKQRHIKVHEIDQQNPDILRQLEPEKKKDHQWIDMDVSEALTRRRPDMDRVDFAIEVVDGALASASSPSTTITVSGLSYSKTQEAALVVYIQSSDASRVRRKRRTNEKRRRQHKSKRARNGTKMCHRRELLIDFRQLGWNDWIIAPENYKAYQCQGECPYPLPNSMNTTNHAIVQGILSSINPEKVPPPCCVPIEMGSLPLLYTDVDGTIVVKKYPDMEVKTCGCR